MVMGVQATGGTTSIGFDEYMSTSATTTQVEDDYENSPLVLAQAEAEPATPEFTFFQTPPKPKEPKFEFRQLPVLNDSARDELAEPKVLPEFIFTNSAQANDSLFPEAISNAWRDLKSMIGMAPEEKTLSFEPTVKSLDRSPIDAPKPPMATIEMHSGLSEIDFAQLRKIANRLSNAGISDGAGAPMREDLNGPYLGDKSRTDMSLETRGGQSAPKSPKAAAGK